MRRFRRCTSAVLAFTLLASLILSPAATFARGVSNSVGVPEVRLAATEVSASGLDAIVPDTTKVLDAESRSALNSASDDMSVLSFSTVTNELSGVGVGDVLVSEPTEAAPDGLLRRVTSVSEIGGGVSYETTVAALDEAVEQGSASFDGTLTADDVAKTSVLRAGVQAVSSSSSNGPFVNIGLTDVVLYDRDGNNSTTADQVRAKGSIRIEPNLHFSAEIQSFKLKSFEFKVTADETARLEVGSKVDLAQFSAGPFQLAQVNCSPITIMMGPIPVVLTPKLKVTIGADGKVTVGASAAVTQQATFAGGVQYANSTWSPIWSFTNTFGYDSPAVTFEAKAEVWAAANLEVLVYGITGPYLTGKRYFEINVKPFEAPWWTLTGGLKVDAGVVFDIKILTKHVTFGYTKNLLDHREIIAQAPGGPPAWLAWLFQLLSRINAIMSQWGGTIHFGGGFGFGRLFFPVNAVTSSTEVTATVYAPDAPQVAGDGRKVARIVHLEASNPVFDKPVRLELNKVPGYANQSIYWWNSDTDAWERIPSFEDGEVVYAEIEHFSWYGIGGDPIQITSTPASSDWSLALCAVVAAGLGAGAAIRRRRIRRD